MSSAPKRRAEDAEGHTGRRHMRTGAGMGGMQPQAGGGQGSPGLRKQAGREREPPSGSPEGSSPADTPDSDSGLQTGDGHLCRVKPPGGCPRMYGECGQRWPLPPSGRGMRRAGRCLCSCPRALTGKDTGRKRGQPPSTFQEGAGSCSSPELAAALIPSLPPPPPAPSPPTDRSAPSRMPPLAPRPAGRGLTSPRPPATPQGPRRRGHPLPAP